MLNELERLAKAATQGPWERGTKEKGSPLHVYCDDALGSAVCYADSQYGLIQVKQRINDLDYIAAANPETILSMIANLRACAEAMANMHASTEIISEDYEDNSYFGKSRRENNEALQSLKKWETK